MNTVGTRLSPSFKKLRQFKDVIFCGKYLILTNIGISVSLSAFGDVLQQSYMINNGHQKGFDTVRTHHMSFSGATIGVLCHYWYNFIDRVLPGRTFQTVMKKVIADQFIFSPVSIAVFFLTLGVLESKSSEEVYREIWTKGKLLYKAEWVVWPPAQIINFYLLPTKYRVLYDSTVSLGYDIYTSYVKHDIDC